MSWTSEQITVLIETYQKWPCLYAVKHTHYHNKHMRTLAIQQVVEALRPFRPMITEAEVQKKFQGLRTTYMQERKKVLSSTHSGMGEDQIYTPSLWYYQKMDFLQEHVAVRTSKANWDMPSQDAPVSHVFTSSSSQSAQRDEVDSEIVDDFLILEDVSLSPVSTLTLGEGTVASQADPLATTPATSSRSKPGSSSGQRLAPKSQKRTATAGVDNELTMLNLVTKDLGTVVSTLQQPPSVPLPSSRDADDIFGEFVATQLKSFSNRKRKANVIFAIHRLLHDEAQQDSD